MRRVLLVFLLAFCSVGIWAAEQANYLITAGNLPIRQAIVDDNAYNRKKFEAVPAIKFITIHNTAEPYSAMQERTRVNTRTSSVTSFQFAVDENEAVQILPDNAHGWHAGDGRGQGNMASIGIEICRSQCIGYEALLYQQAEANAIKLCAYLLKKYQLSVNDLRMHFDWSKKHCPHRILDAGSWEDFKRRVAVALAAESAPAQLVVRDVPRDAAHDMGGINIFGKNGDVKFNTMYGKDFQDAESLIVDLKSRNISVVTVSSWVMDYPVHTLLDALRRNQIEVKRCYVPKKGVPNWVRQNVLDESRP